MLKPLGCTDHLAPDRRCEKCMDYQHEKAVLEYQREERLNNMKKQLDKNKSDPCAGCVWPKRHDGKTVCPFVRCVDRSGFISEVRAVES